MDGKGGRASLRKLYRLNTHDSTHNAVTTFQVSLSRFPNRIDDARTGSTFEHVRIGNVERRISDGGLVMCTMANTTCGFLVCSSLQLSNFKKRYVHAST